MNTWSQFPLADSLVVKSLTMALSACCFSSIYVSPVYCQTNNHTNTSTGSNQRNTRVSQPTGAQLDATKRASIKGNGIINGKVEGAYDKQPIVGARVVLSKMGKPDIHEQVTDRNGAFNFAGLANGDWVLRVTFENMLSESKTVQLAKNESRYLQFSLAPVEPTDILRITGKRTLIHPERIGSTTHLDRKFINQYGSGNDLRQDLESTPGVLSDSLGNIIVRGEHNAVNYVMDGVVLPEAAGVLQQGQFASPRSLQSIDVDIGGYQASDGGGPMGAVARLKSLPIQRKPIFDYGGQVGGPTAGSVNYYAGTALAQDPRTFLGKILVESSGAVVGNSLGLQPPVAHFRRNARANINILNKVEFQASDSDLFRLTAAINESFMQIPESGLSSSRGVAINQHDRQNYIILSHKHKYSRFFDESNLHVLTSFYSQRMASKNVFDPDPVINGDGLLNSVAPNAKRLNFAAGLQGDIGKTAFKTHTFKSGFLTELRPVRTEYSAWYYNADPRVTANSGIVRQTASQNAIANDLANGVDAVTAAQDGLAAAAAIPFIPYGGIISPFTQQPQGPQLQNGLGKFRGFRALQSYYLQDTWRPQKGALKRLTVDAGARADVYIGWFGNTLPLAAAIMTTPGTPPFALQEFKSQTVGNGQLSGRYGASYVLTKNTVVRGSYSQIFTPPSIDLLVRPFDITNGTITNGAQTSYFNGAIRPMHATRGQLIDTSIERQIGKRFVIRNNLFYKKLNDVGDELPVDNTVLYQRLTLSQLGAYGMETRIDLKPGKSGYGLLGYVSNTISTSYLHGSKHDTGGIYDIDPSPVFSKYIDHDRRENLSAALGYRLKNNFWMLAQVSSASGFMDERDPSLFGPHPARSRPVTLIGLNFGYQSPAELQKKTRFIPKSIDVRINNLANAVVPVNLGSPFQGTRYSLPLQVLVGMNWTL